MKYEPGIHLIHFVFYTYCILNVLFVNTFNISTRHGEHCVRRTANRPSVMSFPIQKEGIHGVTVINSFLRCV